MAEADPAHLNRDVDRIDTGPRFSEAEAISLNRRFRGADTAEMLQAVITDGLVENIAMVSSFGAESAALLHLVAQVDNTLPVLFLETGKHFPETLAYRDLLAERFNLTDLRNITPDEAALADKDQSGLRWSYDPDGCCDIRKVIPLEKALRGFDATLTGRKAFQSKTRAMLPRFEIDVSDTQGRLKINPIIDWDADRIEAYLQEHDIPRHPLVEEGYPSIGCAPCTSKVVPGEDPRSGRWKGWDKTECGIHSIGSRDDDGNLKPGFEPYL